MGGGSNQHFSLKLDYDLEVLYVVVVLFVNGGSNQLSPKRNLERVN